MLLARRYTQTMTRSIRCLTCGTTVTTSRQVAGCNCDSDAPTWCALDGDRLITMSYARYEDVTD